MQESARRTRYIQNLRRADESQPLAGIFLVLQRNVAVAPVFVWPPSIFVISSNKETFLKHTVYIYVYIYDTTCLHVPFLSHVSLLCNPSPLLPRYHSSSPRKLSCSEPQRTLLSVEFQILSFSICLPLCS